MYVEITSVLQMRLSPRLTDVSLLVFSRFRNSLDHASEGFSILHLLLSSSPFALDIALGIGGLPKERVVKIYGPKPSEKITLALHVISEHALDKALAKSIGVNTENLLLSQPDCGEQALSLVDTLIRSSSVDVIIVDSDYIGSGGCT
ncbi:DNA repair protein recA homolog 3, mitochondrial-like [Arachis duranensis]|uniref:DNA repair protein recA homolog 3, mitochondrial-like n=1 Tax=Arachis duranensis TaxID=130453 RepID=A0A9C6TBP5_ARADU|nr:DNA repair protein recA homolog 3, mitochondrial-like [Arachis duranensis]